ncbi:hypothetical protein [Gimesia aquarii]|uniref:Uncharacterized protein n=1 Tax=Gimesia aquarii TaxID=2527964 RepID=A0A517VPW3_9PLAN|nr:hypothetical protein [Gimesia aquarii]QDT95057.1 hypothetical protein V144x_04910 [Gimesia aquarii]
MARKSPSRLEMRRQAEAAEADAKTSPKKKAVKKKKAVRKKKATKTEVRRRLFWGVFTGSMKEESRFSYDQRDAAEERIEQLRAKNAKKLYFIQPIKEPLDGQVAATKAPEDDASDLDDEEETLKVQDEPEVIDDDVDEIDAIDDEIEVDEEIE